MKKFIISTGTLKPILAKLSQAVSKQSVLPVMENVLCKILDNQVQFIATDLELTIICLCNAETFGEKFDILLPFSYLKNIVGLNKAVPLTIEMKGNKGIIHGVNDSYEIGTLDEVTSFPAIPEMPKQNFIKINGTFTVWLNKAMIAVSKDETRPAMNKICLDIMTNGMTMTATDAHIMFTRSFPLESKSEEILLISPKVAKALDGFTETSIYWKKSHIGFQCNDITIIATRCTEKYPNYKSVIPSIPKNLLLDKEALCDALDKCSLSSDSLKSASILLKEEKGTIRFEAIDNDLNRRISVDIPGTFEGDTDMIFISATKMLSLLSQIDYDKVNLHINKANKAILITADNDIDYMGLIMPIMHQ